MAFEDADRILVYRNGVNYKTTIGELKEYILAPEPKPWDGNGYHYHILNNTEEMDLGWDFMGVWDVATEQEIGTTRMLPPNSNVVVRVTPVQFLNFSTSGNFEFGEYTDVSECRQNVGLSSPEFNTSVQHLNYTDEMTTMLPWNCPKFNQSVSHWDTSNVLDMRSMWSGCAAFNQPLNTWDVSKVRMFNMTNMFNGATAFDQDISNWCVSNQLQKPDNFDTGAGFEGNAAKQPQWGTCP